MKYLSSADTLALLKKSTDGGTTYSALTYTGSPFNGDMHFVPNSPNTYVSTGVDATNQPTRIGFTYSFDGGSTWYTEPSILGTQITCSQWLNDSTGWLGSFNTVTSDGLFKFNGTLALPVSAFMTPDTLIVLGGKATFTNLSTGSPTTYAWTFTGGSPSSSALKNPPPVTYSTPGSYNVKLVVTNGFGTNTLTKTSYIHVGGVGINEINQNDITVYPNPGKDYIKVQANSDIKEVYIYNVTGQLLLVQTVNAKKVTLNVSGLNTGIYSLKAILDNGTITRKVVIQ
jgi:hypothetical protein